MNRALSTAGRVIFSLLLIAGITEVDLRLFHVNSATAAFTFLLAVLALATFSGLLSSISASLAGMLCYNYFFLPPVGTFTIGDPENWVALVAFLITAVTASQLSSSAQNRAREALARQRELERLNQFSRAMMLLDSTQALGGQIAGQVLRIFDLREVAFFDRATGQVRWAGLDPAHVKPALLQEQAMRAGAGAGEAPINGTLADSCYISPVSLGGQPVGSIGICGTVSEAALRAIASLSAIVLERGRIQDVTARAEAARQNEQLKSTLLDALAHEFKTPLTSIKAAITSALSRYAHGPAEQDLLSIVDEEADRMNAMVTESIEVARVEAGHLHLHREPCRVSDLIAQALVRIRSFLDDREVEVSIPESLPAAHADANLIGLAARQLLHNAVKYSSPNSPIGVEARADAGEIEVRITNQGEGIPEHEQAAIFEKFYRGKATRERIPGTGLGLTIAREIVAAHGGQLRVVSQPGRGATFLFTLPIASNKEME
jgi:two-component system sensor histidine kinase KdpD